ncbi:MAG TPA: hypothetical protein VMV41_16520 [Cellulomonadaceae bacterium]|nr:hypothetical protein [Cellulomonadaceae bacterium]
MSDLTEFLTARLDHDEEMDALCLLDGCEFLAPAAGDETGRKALARVIWNTSRADEGTISATGANHVADAVLAFLAAHGIEVSDHG